MNRQGTIKKIEGKNVWISFAPLACCSGDGSACHCASSTALVEFKALNNKNLNLSLGDYVEVSTPTGAAWGGVVRLVVVPAALLALGLVFWNGWVAAVLAAVGLGASLIFPQNPESGHPKVEAIIPVGDFTPFAARA
ncbi:MAG: SoxR reducing system RseC family protein [Spirochaetales bacterium]